MKKTLMMAMILGAALQASDGAALFNKCAACHGVSGEKMALGKSKVINTLTPDQIESALTGYKNGTYGGSMKALMKGQVSSLSDEDIKTIAAYIGAKAE